MRNLVFFILTFTFSAFSAPINRILKDEERIVYDKYNHIRNEINFVNNEKAFPLSKASDYAEITYSDAASKSKYSFFKNSEGSIAFLKIQMVKPYRFFIFNSCSNCNRLI